MSSHSPKDLYQLSIITVLKNSKRWLSTSPVAVSPFNSLPTIIAQDLLDAYEKIYDVPQYDNNKDQEQACWRLFVTKQVNRIRISENTDIFSLRYIATTCQNIRHLEIHNIGSGERTHTIFRIITKKILRGIRILELQLCSLNTSSVKLIRSECNDLRALRLSSCCVTDKSIAKLKRMSKLIEVDLRDTEVSSIGAVRVLKRNPQLLIFRHGDLLHILPRLERKSVKLELKELQITFDATSTSIAQSVVSTCPKLEQINIELDYRIPNTILNPLYKLKNLNELHVHCICEHVTLSQKVPETLFDESILPILKIRGSNLKALSLECVVGVNLEDIQLFCQNLKQLTLYFNSYVPVVKLPVFKNITKFQFGSQAGGGDHMSTKILKSLLSHAKELEELSLSSSPLYTKSLFQEVHRVNKFEKLNRLELDYCDLPPIALDILMSSSLAELSICGHRAHEQATRALELTKAKSLPTRLEAFTYSFMRCHKRIVRFKQILDVRA